MLKNLKNLCSVVKDAKEVVGGEIKERKKARRVEKMNERLEELDRTIRILKIKRRMEKEEGRSTTETSFLLRNAKEERAQTKVRIIQVQFE